MEKGVHRYDFNRDAEMPPSISSMKRWTSVADLNAHLNAKHIVALPGRRRTADRGAPDIKIMVTAGARKLSGRASRRQPEWIASYGPFHCPVG